MPSRPGLLHAFAAITVLLGASCAANGTPPVPRGAEDSGPGAPDGGGDRDSGVIVADGGGAGGPAHFTLRIENVAPFTTAKSGVFDVRTGGTAPGPLAPGQAYEVTFTAGPRHRLVFATMFGASNDWFFAPAPDGIALFDGMTPISGDVTDQVRLWDAGTEIDEEPAVGLHTGTRQAMGGADPGAADPNHNVREVSDPALLSDGRDFDRPAVSAMIRVTIASDAATRMFTLRIQNVASDATTLQTSEGAKPVRISPGVWALGTGNEPLFTSGAIDRGEGLEAIAETGAAATLGAALAALSGVATPLSPGVWILHTTSGPLFVAGEPDRGEGLEHIAERGDVSSLEASLGAALPEGARTFGVFNTPAGTTEAGPIRPGGAYELEIVAMPGERLSLATMYGASNDWFFSPAAEGIALFDGNSPRRGDVTAEILLWDVGTELSEEPSVGLNIGGPEGPLDPDTSVREVATDEYGTPVSRHLRITLGE